MKLKRMIFTVATILLIVGAWQNAPPVAAFDGLPLTSAIFIVQNAFPASNAYFSIPAAACDSSMYIKDVTIPDGMKIKPGTAFIKKWRIKNTGSCAWNKKYSLQFADGENMSGETTHLAKWVPPGKSIVVSVNMAAPETIGTYIGYWILTNSNGTPFGGYVTVKIVVSNKKP